MFNTVSQSLDFFGTQITLETGKIARQADGSVWVSCGNTRILCNVVYTKDSVVKHDFFPLQVVYQEKFSADGRIPAGFIKRETKPSEAEVLTSRLIDRSIRPVFDSNFINETQVIATVFSYDETTNLSVLALLGCVAALRISGIPFTKTIAGVRVGYENGEFTINNKFFDLSKTSLDMFVSGTKDSVLMIETEAKEVSEEILIEGVKKALDAISILVDFIDEFADRTNKVIEKKCFEVVTKDVRAIEEDLESKYFERLKHICAIPAKGERYAQLELIKSEIIAGIEDASLKATKLGIFKEIQKKIVRQRTVLEGVRVDGRATNQIRPITIELGLLPKCHGSVLFTRGETQTIASLTIGSSSDEQKIDTLESQTTENFMFNYNFPGYSVGEIARFSGPGRREIGHGSLARKALSPLFPSRASYPYSVRLVSDITESNGSTSMASVCGGCLAMFNGGVPYPKIVSGIAMGLIKEGDKYVVLSDILGDEDFLGDMDFKVAGTADGVTALQMDMKILGISIQILQEALQQAKVGREHIADIMKVALEGSSTSQSAPKSHIMSISRDKIRDVIGSGGSVIKNICQQSGATIDVEKSGEVRISSASQSAIDIAVQMISEIAGIESTENEVKVTKDTESTLINGQIYDATVVKLTDYGFMVAIEGLSQSALLHVSEISESRVDNPSHIACEGEILKVRFSGFDEQKRAKLSMKYIDQENGEYVGN